MAVDSHRPPVTVLKSPQEDEEEIRRKKEAFVDLITLLDSFSEMQGSHLVQRQGISGDLSTVCVVHSLSYTECCSFGVVLLSSFSSPFVACLKQEIEKRLVCRF